MTPAPKNIMVGIESGTVVPNNDYRRGVFIRNLSENKVCVAFGQPAVMNKGIVLFAKEAYSMTTDDFSTEEIFGISDAESLVSYQEYETPGER